ncbi:MAG: type II secretion system secretin GspD [Syntrophales bacterium]|nr:type II secretion system secretin GspD [Syntrophales bacterium]
MTKFTDRSSIFCVVLFAVLAFSGCAGQAPHLESNGLKASGSGDVKTAVTIEAAKTIEALRPVEGAKTIKAVKPVEDAKIAKRKERPRIIADDTGEFELVRTPYGYIKHRIKKTESTSVSPVSPVGVSVPAGGGSVKLEQQPVPSVSPVSPVGVSVPAGGGSVKLEQQPVPSVSPASKLKQPLNPVPPHKATEKTAKKFPEEKGGVTFNFDNADIYEVIRTISELLQINYIVDPSVRGNVTIRTTRGLSKGDIFPVFRQILEASGLMIVEEGAVYNIVSIKDASRMPLALRSERDADDISPSERIVIQIIPLKFIAAQEMVKLLTPFVSSTGALIPDAGSNTLLAVDKGINILKVMKLTEAFDVNLLEKVSHRFYFFKNVDAEDAAKTLKEIAASYPTIGKGTVGLIAIDRLNAVLAITSQTEILEKLDAFVARLDIPSEDMEPRIYVYSVKNGEAAQLGTLLNTIFGKGETLRKTTSKEFVHPNPLAVDSGKKQPEQAESKVVAQEATPGVGNISSVTGEIKITPDEVRNALIISATPRDYKIVTGILERIDVLPRQVLIEATVAEITLGKGYEMGVEWTFKNEPWSQTGVLSGTMGGAGLNYAIGLTDKWQVALSALQQDNKVNILSSPHVLASDNKEARIDISTEIPVASTQYTITTNTDPVLETSIQYRDTGVMLTVTPHINERGLVTMEISQEVSEQSSSVSVAGKDYPSFYKRSVNTTLTVKHGQTLVIGGLISEVESDAMAGVPCLVSVPLMRYLFGKDKQSRSKTELIVMITPRVIINLEDVDAVTEEFQEKVSQVRDRMIKGSK